MTVPPGDVGETTARKDLETPNNIFKDFVECMTCDITSPVSKLSNATFA